MILYLQTQKSKTSEPHILILTLTDKLDLRRGKESIALSNLSIYYTGKNIKSLYNNNKFKTSASHGMINLNYQMAHILYQIFKIILCIF